MKFLDEFLRKKHITKSIAKYFIRAERGQTLISKVSDPIKNMLDGAVYLFAIKGLTGIMLPVYWIPVIVLSKKVLEPIIAYIDEQIGFWKIQNNYNSYDLNPFNQKLIEIVQETNSIVRDINTDIQELKKCKIN